MGQAISIQLLAPIHSTYYILYYVYRVFARCQPRNDFLRNKSADGGVGGSTRKTHTHIYKLFFTQLNIHVRLKKK